MYTSCILSDSELPNDIKAPLALQMLNYQQLISALPEGRITDWLYYHKEFLRNQARDRLSFRAVDMSVMFSAKEWLQAPIFAQFFPGQAQRTEFLGQAIPQIVASPGAPRPAPFSKRVETATESTSNEFTFSKRADMVARTALAHSQLIYFSFRKGFCEAYLAELQCEGPPIK